MEELSVEDYIKALEKLKNNPRDRLGILGELGATGIGLTAGAAASGTIATAAGATTLLGSTTLASFLGGVFVTVTPIGWIVGTSVAGGVLAYVTINLVRSGANCDAKRTRSIKKLEERIDSLRKKTQSLRNEEDKMSNIITSVQYLVLNSRMSQAKGIDILKAIEKGSLNIDEAFKLIQDLIHDCEQQISA